jgi:hypothetical protein
MGSKQLRKKRVKGLSFLSGYFKLYEKQLKDLEVEKSRLLKKPEYYIDARLKRIEKDKKDIKEIRRFLQNVDKEVPSEIAKKMCEAELFYDLMNAIKKCPPLSKAYDWLDLETVMKIAYWKAKKKNKKLKKPVLLEILK